MSAPSSPAHEPITPTLAHADSQSSPPKSSPQKPILPEPSSQEAKKMATLQSKIATLQTQLAETEDNRREIDLKLKTYDPALTVKNHICLLHEYNEIRDVGQGLMGMIADKRGVRVKNIYDEFGVGEGD